MSLDIIHENLASGTPVVLWSAFGTEAERNHALTLGLPLWTGALAVPEAHNGVQTPPGLWVPGGLEISRKVQDALLAPGPDATQAATFRISPYIFDKAGLNPALARTATLDACRVASEARDDAQKIHGRQIAVGATLGPLEDCYSPKATPDQDVLEAWHPLQADNLKGAHDAGWIDFVQVETIPTVKEAEVIARELKRQKLPFGISFYPGAGADGNIASGETWEEALEALAPFKPLFIGPNCGPTQDITVALERLSRANRAWGLNISAFGNGPAKNIAADASHTEVALLSPDGWDTRQDRLDEHALAYSQTAVGWRKQFGVAAVGACCGSTPAYTSSLKTWLQP